MKDKNKYTELLIEEIELLKAKIAKLEKTETEHLSTEHAGKWMKEDLGENEKIHSLMRLAHQLELANSFSEIVNPVKEEFQKILGHGAAWIYLFEDDCKYARLLSGTGKGKTELHDIGPKLKIKGDPLLEKIAMADDIVIVEDTREDRSTNKETDTNYDNATVVQVPVLFENKRLGSIGIESFGGKDERTPSYYELEYLKAVADIVAVVIVRRGFIKESSRVAERIADLAEFNKNIVSSAPVGIVTINLKGKVTSANDAFLEMMGSPGLEETLKLGLNIQPVIKAGIAESFQKALISGESFEMKYLHYTSHWGKKIIANLKGVPQKTKDGRIYGIILVVDNVTARVKAEQALSEDEKRFHSLVESVADGIIISDQSGNITLWNKGAQNIFGYKANEIIGKPVTELMPEDYRLRHLEGIERLVNTGESRHFGKVMELQGLRKDGTIFPLELSLSSWQTREMRFFAAIIRDITMRKQAEDALRQSEARWRSLTENSPDHIMLINTDYTIRFINHTVDDLTKEQVIGKSVFDFVPSDYYQVAVDCFEHVIQVGEPNQYETKYITSKGETEYFDVRISPVTDKDGNITGLISTSNNITERKQAEKEREKLLHDKGERVKELQCLYGVTESIRTRIKREEIFRDVVNLIPPGWQYPEITRGKIVFDGRKYVEEQFKETNWKQSSDIIVNGEIRGSIEVYYLKECPELDEGPFLREERSLIDGIARNISEAIELRLVEETLNESEERYRAVVENSHDGILIIDEDFRFVYSNNMLCEILGRSQEEIIGLDFREVLDEDSKQLVTDMYIRRQKGEELPTRYEFNVVRKDGETRMVEISSTVIKDSKGRIRTIAQILDITTRKRAEQALTESEEKFRNLYDFSNDSIILHNLDGNIIDANKKALEQFGYTREEIITMKIEELHPPGTSQASQKAFSDIKKQGFVTFEIDFKKSNDEIFPAEVSSSLLEVGGESVIQGIVRDITERKQTEQAIRDSEYLLRESQRVANLGSYILDVSSGIWKSSPILDDVFGIDKKFHRDLSGWLQIVHPKDYDMMKDYFATNVIKNLESFDKEYRIKRINDQQERWVHGLGELEFDDDGNPIKMIGTIQDISERKISELALQKSEESLKLAQEFGNVGSWDWDILNNKLTWTDQSFIQMGLNSNEVEPTIEVFENLIHPDDREFVTSAIEQTFKYDKPYSLEVRMIKPDGKEWIMHTEGKVIRDLTGNPIRFLGVQRDITERKQAEEALRESEDKYRDLLEHSPNGMVVHSDRKIVYVNKATVKILNAKDKSDIVGKSVFSFMHPDSIERLKQHAIKTFKEDNIIEPAIEKLIGLDGTIKEVEITGVPITYDQKPAILVIAKDISELQKAYKEIQKNQERLTALVNALPDLIFVINKEGVVLESYHYKDEEEYYIPASKFLGKKVSDFLPKEVADGTIYHMRKIFETGELQTYNYSLQIGEETKYFEARMTLKGKEEILVAARDITVRKAMEKQLQQSHSRLRSLAERLQVISEEERAAIAREIHDDLGQSLTALKMDISWMKNNPEMDEKKKTAKYDIMLGLTNSTIQTVKRIATELRPGILDDLGLVPAIEWQAGEFQNRFNVQCNVSINKSDVLIKDEISIAVFRIFQETLTNIAKHSGATKVDINLNFDDNKLIMEIADNGIGIDEEQTNSPTSFGLFGMNERVNILNGELKIFGEHGKGTRIRVSIPISIEDLENKQNETDVSK